LHFKVQIIDRMVFRTQIYMLEYNLIVLEQVGEKKWIRVLREELRENAMVCGIELIGVLWVVMGVKI